MVVSCCAYECTNRWGKLKEDGTKLQFHLFPLRKPDLLKKWIVAVRRASWEPSKSSALCGDHFAETAYRTSARHYLKDDAVPSIFSFSSHLRKTKRDRSPSCESIQHPLPRCSSNCQYQMDQKDKKGGQSIASGSKADNVDTKISSEKKHLDKLMENFFEKEEGRVFKKEIRIENSSVYEAIKVLKKNEENSQNQGFAISSSSKNEAGTSLMSLGNDERNKRKKGSKLKGTQTELTSSDILKQKLELKQLQAALLRQLEDNDSLRKKCKGTQTKLTSSDILNQNLELKQLREFYESNALLRNVTKMQALYNEGLASKQIEFTLNQISNFERKTPHWSDSVLRECVFLQATSPEGYEALRDKELLKLPGRRTLSKFLKATTTNNTEEFCDAIFKLPATTDHDELSDTHFEPTTATDQDELSDQILNQLQ